jgi:hypothetical protein
MEISQFCTLSMVLSPPFKNCISETGFFLRLLVENTKMGAIGDSSNTNNKTDYDSCCIGLARPNVVADVWGQRVNNSICHI